MREYSSLQFMLDDKVEAARERIIYAVTAYMDGIGMVPCGRESAERTVSFARIKGGWAVFDDCADRLDMHALHGLARCLTSGLHTKAVGIMGYRDGFILRLYCDGRLRDNFNSSPGSLSLSSKAMGCSGHAIRWRSILCENGSIRELSAAFAKSRRNPSEGFYDVCRLLSLDKSAEYGFSSIEDAKLEGVITLYFHTANCLRQRWLYRIFHYPVKCKGAAPSAFTKK
ncbi:MAG: hypothetical protein PHH84_04330 [Oscillospiraceae bacterium]|nr:hypothetical protein [Oscillospiraceae bacterium]MDD4414878.1 hypothetical protein [Oscillospiraceae bacterium]